VLGCRGVVCGWRGAGVCGCVDVCGCGGVGVLGLWGAGVLGFCGCGVLVWVWGCVVWVSACTRVRVRVRACVQVNAPIVTSNSNQRTTEKIQTRTIEQTHMHKRANTRDCICRPRPLRRLPP
jgi:hypothetical protein